MLIARRRALALAALLPLSAAACTQLSDASNSAGSPDQLKSILASARSDAAQLRASIALNPAKTAALSRLAEQRAAHARAIAGELARAFPGEAEATVTDKSAKPEPVATLRANLRNAQRTAAQLANDSSGYRAGLLAAVSAACAVGAEVTLA